MCSERIRLLLRVAGFLALGVAPSSVAAQTPDPTHPYPTSDSPLALPSGTVVHQRNLVVFRGRGVSTLTMTIETPTPPSDSERVAREAFEMAVLHDASAETQSIRRITVAVCRSQACLELRELATEMFHFVRGNDGTWAVDPSHIP